MIRESALDELARRLPDGEGFLAAVAGPFRRAIRVHPRRGRPSGWGGLTAIPWNPDGRFHAPDIDPGGRLDYHTGTAYPQDAASQLPAVLLAPVPGETIVDVCAAPGSKSTQIGLALGDRGLLICADASPPRRRVLVENLARQGVACALVTPMPVVTLAERHPACADGVLVDAPCSGHEPRSSRQVARMAQRQVALLALAARLARPGGRVVYSTCTPYAEEDEGVVAAFLASHEGWAIERMALDGCDPAFEDAGGWRLWPQRQGTEPFFACLLRAPGDSPATPIAGQAPATDATLSRWLPGSPLRCWRRGNAVLSGTDEVAACALPADARGLLLGHGGHHQHGGHQHDEPGGDERFGLEPWAAQALIERGAPALEVAHAQALELWSGRAVAGLEAGVLLRTDAGAPLAQAGSQGRLALPSRMFRDGLI